MTTLKTEEQAREMWCPFVRLARTHGDEVPHGQAVFNRLADGDGSYIPIASKCIASKCMAWRWGRRRWVDEGGKVYSEPMQGLKGDWQVKGVCGLAGSPP